MFTNPSDANHFLRSLFWTLVYENKIINIKQYFFIFRILMIKKEKRNKRTNYKYQNHILHVNLFS